MVRIPPKCHIDYGRLSELVIRLREEGLDPDDGSEDFDLSGTGISLPWEMIGDGIGRYEAAEAISGLVQSYVEYEMGLELIESEDPLSTAAEIIFGIVLEAPRCPVCGGLLCNLQEELEEPDGRHHYRACDRYTVTCPVCGAGYGIVHSYTGIRYMIEGYPCSLGSLSELMSGLAGRKEGKEDAMI